MINVRSEYGNDFAVEFEVMPADVRNEIERRKTNIVDELTKVDSELDLLQNHLDKLNSEIDKLTNHADGLDYMVAVGSGIIAGLIDILFVEDLSLEKANAWGDKKVEEYVIEIAKKQAKREGKEINNLHDAIKFLEDNYPIAADKATDAFGGGLQHHLRDFSHHPTPVGLIFSLLTQFTHKVYGTDVTGIFKIVELKSTDLILIGNNLPEKFTFGVINWFFHMVSDMAGSSTSAKQGKVGTGLPGPIGSLLKEISVLPIFKEVNSKGYKEFSVWISKLFNGTLLGERDENGKLVPIKFDLRTEIGIAHQLGQQALPVIVNECIVRGFYFIRRFYMELKANNVHNMKDLKNINWRNTLPFKNRTVIRMLTISTGTMTAIDLADAAIESAIKSGGVTSPKFFKNMIVKVNFVGIGRFAIAVGTEISMEMKKGKLKKERSRVMSDIICLSNVKVYYKNAELMCAYGELYDKEADMHKVESDLWVEVQNTQQSIEELYSQIEKVGMFYIKTIQDMDGILDNIPRLLPGIEEKNPGLLDEIQRRLKR